MGSKWAPTSAPGRIGLVAGHLPLGGLVYRQVAAAAAAAAVVVAAAVEAVGVLHKGKHR